MPLSRRYSPEIAPGESSVFGMDFSGLVPPGVGLANGSLAFQTNTQPPAATGNLTAGAVSVHDRMLYARVTAAAAAAGGDFQLLWTATDTDGNVWPRTALVLCAATS